MSCTTPARGAKSYQARVARSSGTSKKAFQSDFGLRILKKWGWKEGEGLGRRKDGRLDCIQAVRREQGEGLGAQKRKAEEHIWDNWWADCFNTVAKKVKVSSAAENAKQRPESDSESDSEGMAPEGGKITAVKRASVMQGKLRRVLRQERPVAPASAA